MGKVKAKVSREIGHAPQVVGEALADYAGVRPQILPAAYSAYRLLEGGQGTGTVAAWNLRATRRRDRDVEVEVEVSSGEEWTVTETDRNSSMVTVFRAAPSARGTDLSMTTTWSGAKGARAIPERIFAPLGLRPIQRELLENLSELLDSR